MCQLRWLGGSSARAGSNEAATSGAPGAELFPSLEALPLKQCAAVSITVGDSSVPEHVVTPFERKPTYGWALPSYWPPSTAPADPGRAKQATSAASPILRRIRILSARRS